MNVSWKSLQIIGVGHDEREEKAGRVCSTVGQTEGLPFVIGAENKKAKTLTAPTNTINIISQRDYNGQGNVDSTSKKKAIEHLQLIFDRERPSVASFYCLY